ncbi:MAG: hypothetical protein GX218_03525 [Clostridiaceae bacterium]|jgi:uncharacterized protein YneF (UPF0154 family)|nr:hypothetical protein [Clostridiaceae bacterium]
MKKAILPSVFAVAVLILFLMINKQLDIMGYILALAIGALVGFFINQLVFKLILKENKSTSAPSQTATEPIVDEITEDDPA